MFIMDKMLEALPEPREELSPYAPRIQSIKINPEKIGTVIGPGGKMIRTHPGRDRRHRSTSTTTARSISPRSPRRA